MSLGQLVGETSRSLLELQKAARSRAHKRRLAVQLQELLAVTARLVDANVEGATPEYEEAAAGLGRAKQALDDAIEDVAGVANAIELVAKAVDRLAALAAVAA